MVGNLIPKRVYKLIIETCSMTDQGLYQVLEGIQSQCQVDQYGDSTQYLQSFVYSYNIFGVKSMQSLQVLLPNLLELAMNNVQFEGG